MENQPSKPKDSTVEDGISDRSENLTDEVKADILKAAAGVELDATHIAEYEEYLNLKNYFEANPVQYKKMITKLDIRIIPMLFLYYLFNSLDKANAGNIKIYTFLEDTNMTDHQFNLALTWYFFSYSFFETPSNMVLKRVGPKLWLSFLVVCWGFVTIGTAWVNSYGSYVAARFLLGVFEAGLFQGVFFTLSTWYLSHELQKRCAVWYSATMLSGAIGGLLAYAVGPLQGRLGLNQWQYLFIIEGTLTVACGLIGFWLCVDFPDKWTSRFFKKDEMRFLRLRVKYCDGPIPPSEQFSWSIFFEVVKDWKVYPIASLLALGGSVPTYSVNYTLPTMVTNLGYYNVQAQALSSCPYFFAIFAVIGIAFYSDKYQCRAKSLLISYAVGMVGIIILWVTVYHPSVSGVSYFALFLIVAGFNMQGPAVGSWLGTNIRNPSKRATAMGYQSTFGQLVGGCIGANIFLARESPTYTTGFSVITVSVMVGGVLVTIVNWYFLRKANLKKDKLDMDEIRSKYSEAELQAMGEYSPLFRYIL